MTNMSHNIGLGLAIVLFLVLVWLMFIYKPKDKFGAAVRATKITTYRADIDKAIRILRASLESIEIIPTHVYVGEYVCQFMKIDSVETYAGLKLVIGGHQNSVGVGDPVYGYSAFKDQIIPTEAQEIF